MGSQVDGLEADSLFDDDEILQFTDTLDRRKYMRETKSAFGFDDEDGLGPSLSDSENSGDDLEAVGDAYDAGPLTVKFDPDSLSEYSTAAGITADPRGRGSPVSASPSPSPAGAPPASSASTSASATALAANAAAYEAMDRNCRFEIIMEAGTAAAQRVGDGPLTYLNKGQYYAINLTDRHKGDVMHTTTLRVRFHDPEHQQEKNENWRIWLMQQPSRSARPMEIDKMASIGTRNLDTSEFDAIRFQWNGTRGAKILVKLNCLSTEFSRTKGVKGIHLRLQTETEAESGECESQYCRIKVFRDKGAQRKNRDDQKAVEKRLEKLMRDSQDVVKREGLPVFMPPQPITRFILDPETLVFPAPAEDPAAVAAGERLVSTALGSSPSPSPALGASSSNSSLNGVVVGDGTLMPKAKSRKHEFVDIADLELEPHLPPAISRKKRPVLCILLKTPEDPVYSAIFLERLTAEDFRRKLAERCGIDLSSITNLCRITKKGLVVKVDDRMVENFEDEQDFVMESTYNSADGTVSISLR